MPGGATTSRSSPGRRSSCSSWPITSGGSTTTCLSGVEDLCQRRGEPLRKPQEGDLFLACCDALIAAQTAVVAAESLGIGSCYIGDIMENYEIHRELFGLPQYVFPICLLCFGYPTQGQMQRPMTLALRPEVHCLSRIATGGWIGPISTRCIGTSRSGSLKNPDRPDGITNVGQANYVRKFAADFSKEMTRSVQAILRNWE